MGFYAIAHYISLSLVFYACGTASGALLIDDYGKDGGTHFTQCMIGICPLATHSYQTYNCKIKSRPKLR